VTAPQIENTVQQLCQFIERNCEATLTLAALARQAGVSPFHLQRSFQSLVGVSPRRFQQACRLQRLKASLRTGAQATQAIFDAGYGSLSRVYEKTDASLGMTPIDYRRGGQGLTISHANLETPLGPMLLAATDRGLCFLQFGAAPTALQAEFPAATLQPVPLPYSQQLNLWIDSLRAYLEGHRPQLELPLHLRATAFQMKVWRYLQTIPRGQTRSYSEVAAAIGQPTATRAVARACAANNVAIVIPCHRVIRGAGHPGGYRWGLARKEALLQTEKSA
jgi:AraC family transcriptional regulator of adaptative response/methylated-DNA-[protein]-cysteine methyltransferase